MCESLFGKKKKNCEGKPKISLELALTEGWDKSIKMFTDLWEISLYTPVLRARVWQGVWCLCVMWAVRIRWSRERSRNFSELSRRVFMLLSMIKDSGATKGIPFNNKQKNFHSSRLHAHCASRRRACVAFTELHSLSIRNGNLKFSEWIPISFFKHFCIKHQFCCDNDIIFERRDVRPPKVVTLTHFKRLLCVCELVHGHLMREKTSRS